MFELLKTDETSKARRGRLTTTRGVVETPVFMPVGTQASVKALDLRLGKSALLHVFGSVLPAQKL